MKSLEELSSEAQGLYGSHYWIEKTLSGVKKDMDEDPPGKLYPVRSIFGGTKWVEDTFDLDVHRRRREIQSDYMNKRERLLGEAALFASENLDGLILLATQEYREQLKNNAA